MLAQRTNLAEQHVELFCRVTNRRHRVICFALSLCIVHQSQSIAHLSILYIQKAQLYMKKARHGIVMRLFCMISRRTVSRVLSVPQRARICHLSSLHVAVKLKRSTLCRRADNPYPTSLNTSEAEMAVYMNLQQPRCTASMSPCCWWSLAPPSHPYLSPMHSWVSYRSG